MSSELVDRLQITQAVDALKSYVTKVSKQKKNLLNPIELDNIHLQFSCKKVSIAKKTVKILLPHTYVDANTSICLFARDEDRDDRDYSVTVDEVRQLLDNAGVAQPIEIIPLKQLKLEYKEYESKRNLLAMYDIYLADERIVRLLPSQLGKEFYKRKRFPLPVNLTRKQHLKKEIDQALRTTQCIMTGQGCSNQVTVGRMPQSTEEIVDNIVEAIQRISSSVPAGQLNIRSIHVKAQDAPSVPIFISLGSKDDVQLTHGQRRKVATEPEDVTTVANGKVLVTPACNIRVIRSAAGKVESPVRGGKKNKSKTSKKTTANKSHDIPTLVPATAAKASDLVEPKIEVKEEKDEQQFTAEIPQSENKKATKGRQRQSAADHQEADYKIEADDQNVDPSNVGKKQTKRKALKSQQSNDRSSHQAVIKEEKRSSLPKTTGSKERVENNKRSKLDAVSEPAKKRQKLRP